MNKIPQFKIFGDKAVFKSITEELSGSIVLPQKAAKQYELGEVVAIGDGQVKDGYGGYKIRPVLVKPGDIIWFQVNTMMASNNMFRVDGQLYMTIVQHDMLARLKTAKVDIDTFEILGHWVLLEGFEDKKKDSLIYIPDTVETPEVRMLRYRVKQKGSLAVDIEVGQEVAIEKRAAQLVELNGKPYFYIDCRNIAAVIQP